MQMLKIAALFAMFGDTALPGWFADYDRPDKPASVRTGDEESSEQIVSPIPPPHLIISSMSLVMCQRLTLPLFRHHDPRFHDLESLL